VTVALHIGPPTSVPLDCDAVSSVNDGCFQAKERPAMGFPEPSVIRFSTVITIKYAGNHTLLCTIYYYRG
jgi:hypothetical protein